MTAKIFGDFNQNLPAVQHFLAITFAPDSASVKQRWHNNGLSADFMADYFALFSLTMMATTIKLIPALRLKVRLAILPMSCWKTQ
jgi:hypothetical protein